MHTIKVGDYGNSILMFVFIRILLCILYVNFTKLHILGFKHRVVELPYRDAHYTGDGETLQPDNVQVLTRPITQPQTSIWEINSKTDYLRFIDSYHKVFMTFELIMLLKPVIKLEITKGISFSQLIFTDADKI